MSVINLVFMALAGCTAIFLFIAGQAVQHRFQQSEFEASTTGWALLTTGEPIYMPAVAHVGGAVGTDWRSDLELFNAGDGLAQVEIALLIQDQANPSPTTVTSTIDPDTAIRHEDVLDELFAFTGSAALRITATSGEIMATARTYNQTLGGTYGQFIGGGVASDAISDGDEGRIIMLRHNSSRFEGYRTNLGMLNCTASSMVVDIELFDALGAPLGTVTSTLQPYMFTQINKVFEEVTSDDVENGYAVISSATSGGRFFAYASVVDNQTGDPVYIPATVLPGAKSADPGEAVYVVAAAHVPGAGDAQWRTDLAVHNPDSEQAVYEIAALRTNLNNQTPLVTTVSLAGGASWLAEDFLETEIGHTGTAALRVAPQGSGRAVVASRTYNLTDSGTYGQFIGGTPVSEALEAGQRAVMLQLSHQVSKTNTYRTNLGFVSCVAIPITLSVELFDADGTLLGTVPATLGPYMHKQINAIFEDVSDQDVADGYAMISTSTANGRFMAYGSVVDNGTDDPVLAPPSPLASGVALDAPATVEMVFSWLTDWLGQGSIPYVEDAVSMIQSEGIGALLDAIVEARGTIAGRSGNGIDVSYPGGWVLSNGSVANGSFSVDFDNVVSSPTDLDLGFVFSLEGLTIDTQLFPIETINGSADLEIDLSSEVRGVIEFSTPPGKTAQSGSMTGNVEIDTFLCENYPIGGTITFNVGGQVHSFTFTPQCDGSYDSTEGSGDVFRPGPGANNGNDEGDLNGGKDTWFNENLPEVNYGEDARILGAAMSVCNSTFSKAYLKFDLTTLPANVTQVFLGVTHFPHTSYCYSNCDLDYYFFPVTEPWDEMTLTFPNQPEDGGAVFGPINITFPNDFGTREYDITEIYRAWKSGSVPNHGLAIYSPDDTGCNNAGVVFYVHSSDDPDEETRPYLRVVED